MTQFAQPGDEVSHPRIASPRGNPMSQRLNPASNTPDLVVAARDEEEVAPRISVSRFDLGLPLSLRSVPFDRPPFGTRGLVEPASAEWGSVKVFACWPSVRPNPFPFPVRSLHSRRLSSILSTSWHPNSRAFGVAH